MAPSSSGEEEGSGSFPGKRGKLQFLESASNGGAHSPDRYNVKRFSMNTADIATLTKAEVYAVAENDTLFEAVEWLCGAVKTTRGRDAFVTELNQFRSRKVDLGSGYNALVIVLWTALSFCQMQNDVKHAKVIMMLSQVCSFL
jgi:hypothetical protein